MTISDQMQRLEAVLEAYGADRSRWPEAERAALDAFIASHAPAQELMREEAAFDRVLSTASTSAPVATERARAAIFAEIEAEAGSGAVGSGHVIAFDRAPVRKSAPVQPARSLWRELSVMAAALLIGFFTVSQGVLDGSGLDVGSFTASGADYSDDVSAIAMGTTEDAAEEDLL